MESNRPGLEKYSSYKRFGPSVDILAATALVAKFRQREAHTAAKEEELAQREAKVAATEQELAKRQVALEEDYRVTKAKQNNILEELSSREADLYRKREQMEIEFEETTRALVAREEEVEQKENKLAEQEAGFMSSFSVHQGFGVDIQEALDILDGQLESKRDELAQVVQQTSQLFQQVIDRGAELKEINHVVEMQERKRRTLNSELDKLNAQLELAVTEVRTTGRKLAVNQKELQAVNATKYKLVDQAEQLEERLTTIEALGETFFAALKKITLLDPVPVPVLSKVNYLLTDRLPNPL